VEGSYSTPYGLGIFLINKEEFHNGKRKKLSIVSPEPERISRGRPGSIDRGRPRTTGEKVCLVGWVGRSRKNRVVQRKLGC